MEHIIPSNYLLVTKTLDLQGYIKHQQFTPPIHRHVKHTKIHVDRKKNRDGRSLTASIRQLKSRITNIGLCNLHLAQDGYIKFITFTTKESYYDRKIFVRMFTDFIRRFTRHCGYKLYYIAVPEQHDSEKTSYEKRYSYHMHAVFFNIPFMSAKYIRDIWSYGYIKIKALEVENGYRAISYVLKYLAKEGMLNERISMPRYMIRPQVYYNASFPRGKDLQLIYKHATFLLDANLTVETSLHKKIIN